MFGLSRKYRVCRSFNLDLWGSLRTKQTLNQTFVGFIKQYKQRRSPASMFARLAVIRRFRRRSLYGQLLHFRKKLSAFYGGVGFKTAKWNLSQEQMLHDLFKNISSFETRLSTLLYRSHFSESILGSLILILSGSVSVNKSVVRKTNYCVSPGDIFELVDNLKEERFFAFLDKLSLRQIVLFQPCYLEISYVCMSATLIYCPSYKEVHFPFSASI